MVTEEQYFEDFEELEETGDVQTELYEHRRVVADSGQNPVRVDKFLMDHLRDTSRNRIQKAADAGYIMANGKPVKSNYKVKAGDVITLMFDRPKRDWEIIPEDIPLDIVYEDEDLMIINKPANMPIHPSMNHHEGTLANGLLHYFSEKGESFTFRCINRLDRDTSGLTIVAKHFQAFREVF